MLLNHLDKTCLNARKGLRCWNIRKVLLMSLKTNFKLLIKMFDKIHLVIFSKICRVLFYQEFFIDFGVVKHCFIIVLFILLFFNHSVWVLRSIILFAHLSRRPEVPTLYIGLSSSKFFLQLRGITKLQQWVNGEFIKEVDFPNSFLIQEVLNHSP